MNTLRTCAVCALVLCLAFSVYAEWSHDPNENTPVCTANSDQDHLVGVSDGEGGFFLAWQDERASGDINLYAQHLDSRGVPLWTEDGVPLCTVADRQEDFDLIADGSGGIIAAWTDYRGTEIDIYAQRLDSSGSQMWTSGGKLVCGTIGGQASPKLVGDDQGGAYVAWVDYSTDYYKLYAQRIDAGGDTLWSGGGIPVCGAAGDQDDQQLLSDGESGFLIFWHDSRANFGDIYGQRFSDMGVKRWSADGKALCDLSTSEYYPRALGDGSGGAVVTWIDYRSGTADVYAQRVNSAGTAYWTPDGIAVCTASGTQTQQSIAEDGSHGAIICWIDARDSYYDIYAQRITAGGSPVWTADGVPVCTVAGDKSYPMATSVGDGGAVFCWVDDRTLDTDVYCQRVSGAGSVLWDADGVAVSTAARHQHTNRVVSDGKGGIVAAWVDQRGEDENIYAQRVERNGYLGYPSAEISSVSDVPGDQGGQVILAWDASYLDPWPEGEIESYTLWRAVSPTREDVGLPEGAVVIESASEMHSDSDGPVVLVDERPAGTFYWELVSTVDAYHLEHYSAVVPTLFDSTAVSPGYHYFQTIAHTSDPLVFWPSLPESARSFDNLEPGAPLALLADVVSSDVELRWTPSGSHDEDLGQYVVYRSETSPFTPDESTFVGTADDTVYVDVDPGPTTWYYRVVAEDVHGNESDPSNEASATLGTGIEDPEVPAVFALRGAYPNPFGPATRIVFALPAAQHVAVDVYTVAGRHVATLVDEGMGPGAKAVEWDGRDEAGLEVPGGVYLYRVAAGDEQASGKMVIVR